MCDQLRQSLRNEQPPEIPSWRLFGELSMDGLRTGVENMPLLLADIPSFRAAPAIPRI